MEQFTKPRGLLVDGYCSLALGSILIVKGLHFYFLSERPIGWKNLLFRVAAGGVLIYHAFDMPTPKAIFFTNSLSFFLYLFISFYLFNNSKKYFRN